MATAKTIGHPTGHRRLLIQVRPDGLFQFLEEEYRLVDEEYDYWSWMPKWPPSGIFATLDEAEQEARRTIAWLRPSPE